MTQFFKFYNFSSLSFFFLFKEVGREKIKGRRLEKFNRGRKSLLKKKTRRQPVSGEELKY